MVRAPGEALGRGRDPGELRLRAVARGPRPHRAAVRSEEHTPELQSQSNLVCRLLLEKKKTTHTAVPSSESRFRRHHCLNLSLGSPLIHTNSRHQHNTSRLRHDTVRVSDISVLTDTS